jgi:hypothetical protein
VEEWSLAESLLRSLVQETGIAPVGELIQRMDQTPRGSLRRLRTLDAEVAGVAASVPLDLAPVLAELLEEALGEEDRLDLEKAFEILRREAEAGEDEAGEDDAAGEPGDGEEDEDATVPLFAAAHRVLGLAEECEACPARLDALATEAQAAEAEGGHHHHHQPASLLEVVFEEHAADLDAWEPQVARRIARQAGATFAQRSGMGLLHEALGHAGPAVGPEALEEAHGLQHVGMALCEDAAQIQAVRVALGAMRATDGVAEGIDEAELRAVQDAASLAVVPASVAVGLLGAQITRELDSAPPPPPTRRLPKGKRRR